MEKGIIIAIDGYSSTGKSTFAKMVASRYGLTYVDTGALYRGVTLVAVKNHLINDDNSICIDALLDKLSELSFTFQNGKEERCALCINGAPVEKEIRSMDIAEKVSILASIPQIRIYVDTILRKIGEHGGVVMDGRDIGTIVFPNADLKIFMTASPEVRAMRRYKELVARGEKDEYEKVFRNIVERDHLDQSRETAPLKMADDAILLDNSNISLEEQMRWIEKIVSERWGQSR